MKRIGALDPCFHGLGALLPHLFTLTSSMQAPYPSSCRKGQVSVILPQSPDKRGRGGISLLHVSWGCPRRALPVILALWSPDFPHLGPFGSHPRLSDPVAEVL